MLKPDVPPRLPARKLRRGPFSCNRLCHHLYLSRTLRHDNHPPPSICLSHNCPCNPSTCCISPECAWLQWVQWLPWGPIMVENVYDTRNSTMYWKTKCIYLLKKTNCVYFAHTIGRWIFIIHYLPESLVNEKHAKICREFGIWTYFKWEHL